MLKINSKSKKSTRAKKMKRIDALILAGEMLEATATTAEHYVALEKINDLIAGLTIGAYVIKKVK